jgi:hypothetical protein
MSSLLLTDIHGKGMYPSGVVVQVGGIMAVYGLSLRRLTASQRLPADVQSPSEWAMAACVIRRSDDEAMCRSWRCPEEVSRPDPVTSGSPVHFGNLSPAGSCDSSGMCVWLTPVSPVDARLP